MPVTVLLTLAAGVALLVRRPFIATLAALMAFTVLGLERIAARI